MTSSAAFACCSMIVSALEPPPRDADKRDTSADGEHFFPFVLFASQEGVEGDDAVAGERARAAPTAAMADTTSSGTKSWKSARVRKSSGRSTLRRERVIYISIVMNRQQSHVLTRPTTTYLKDEHDDCERVDEPIKRLRRSEYDDGSMIKTHTAGFVQTTRTRRAHTHTHYTVTSPPNLRPLEHERPWHRDDDLVCRPHDLELRDVEEADVHPPPDRDLERRAPLHHARSGDSVEPECARDGRRDERGHSGARARDELRRLAAAAASAARSLCADVASSITRP